MTTQKTAVVTGATSGLGQAAALALAAEGWRVIIIGRELGRGAEVVAQAKAAGGSAEFLSADLFSLADVKRLARDIAAMTDTLHLLINNAGGTFGTRALTGDGLERTFALNVAAPFVLTEGLLPLLEKGKGRVLNVVTGVPNGAKATLDQLTGDNAAAGLQSYIRSKLALLALTREQQKRFASRGVTAVCLHPGIIPGTRFGQDTPKVVRVIMEAVGKVIGLMSTLEEAADRYVKVGTQAVEGGGFYKQGVLTAPPKLAGDEAFGSQLWTKLESVAAARN